MGEGGQTLDQRALYYSHILVYYLTMKDAARRRVEELIERFSRNIDAYKSGSYNEAQTRREFIEPFFELLGWDVYN
ncbi:MAG TPA: hypothetical protein DD725_08090, partial [Deltaproteobacteria bacterium]|nr:hypothetical protein [Deltaproteobacteria bacterium]